MAVYLAMETQDGDVQGDVVDPAGYKDQTLIHSLSFDFQRDWITGPAGGGHAAGRLRSNGARLSCNFGKHAVMIWKALTENQEVQLIATYDTSDDGDDPILQVEFQDGHITSCNFGVGGMGAGTFDFQVQFATIVVTHLPSSMMHTDTLFHETV